LIAAAAVSFAVVTATTAAPDGFLDDFGEPPRDLILS
jgi:hypothetical protein